MKSLDDQTAHWQAGRVQRDGQWLDADQLSDATEQEREYEQLRSQMDDDVNGHRKLAKWCLRNGLTLQARAHWNAVIEKSPNDLEARRQLGHRWTGDAWFTEEEIRVADEASREMLADLKQWNPTVAKIIKTFVNGSSSEKQAALRKLNQLDDPSTIASLEMALDRPTMIWLGSWWIASVSIAVVPLALHLPALRWRIHVRLAVLMRSRN